MAHSKRNTSLAFFTTHERSLLKNTWGSQSTRLTRDSFLPFASCNLCLQPARAAVVCASDGDIFCRECIVSNLLAQKQEIQRLEADEKRRRREGEEEARGRIEEERERSVREFEKTMMGLEGDRRQNGSVTRTSSTTAATEKQGKKGLKRKFELDEADMLDNAKADRAKARKAIDLENASKPTLPSFWVPALTPSTKPSISPSAKLSPICPASTPSAPHPLSLKSLIIISFSTSNPSSIAMGTPTLICPACTKPLSNASKAVMAKPCGHVLCKACAGKFMNVTPPQPSSPSFISPSPSAAAAAAAAAASEEQQQGTCYVCSSPLLPKQQPKEPKKGKGAGGGTGGTTGTVELRSEGTGFAGGGKNMASREGVAFQC